MSLTTLIFYALLYVALLFAVAVWAERPGAQGRARWLRGPVV